MRGAAFLFLFLSSSLGVAAAAQDTATAAAAPSPPDRPRALAIEAGRLYYDSEDLAFQLGLRTSHLSPDGAFDFALAIYPEALGQGALLSIMDFDVSGAFTLARGVWLAPRAGLSLGLGIATEGFGAAAGYNVGGGLVVRASPVAALRLDYTYRRPLYEETAFEGPSFSSVSLGFVVLR